MNHDNHIAVNDIIQLRDGSTYKVVQIRDNTTAILQSIANNIVYKTMELSQLIKQAFVVEFADPIEQVEAELRAGLKTSPAKVYYIDNYRKKVS